MDLSLRPSLRSKPSFEWLYAANSGFNPASLFASGEAGAWYEPSPATCFLSATDLTPCGAGDPCGFMLDRSQGAGYSGGSFTGLGDELVTNGTFDTDLSGWISAGTGTVSWISGQAELADQVVFQQKPVTTGSGVFLLTWNQTITSGTRTRVRVRNAADSADVGPFNYYVSSGTQSLIVSTNSGLTLSYYTDAGNTALLDNISVRELPGNHAMQETASARPMLQQTAGGLWYLDFDGVDDSMVTPAITPGTDKAQVFAGVRKLNDAALGVIYEFSANTNSNNGSFYSIQSYTGSGSQSGPYWMAASKGTTLNSAASPPDYPAPATAVQSHISDIAGDITTLRIDGSQIAQNTSDHGAGNYLTHRLYIGARAGASLFFGGHVYSLIARFGANLDADTIGQTETYVADRAGVTL